MLHSVLFLKIISCTCCLLNEYNIKPKQTHINQENCLEHRRRNWLLKTEDTPSIPNLGKSLLRSRSPRAIYRESLSVPCTHLSRLLHQHLCGAPNTAIFERWRAFFQKWDERLAKMVDTVNKWHRQYWSWKLFYEVAGKGEKYFTIVIKQFLTKWKLLALLYRLPSHESNWTLSK